MAAKEFLLVDSIANASTFDMDEVLDKLTNNLVNAEEEEEMMHIEDMGEDNFQSVEPAVTFDEAMAASKVLARYMRQQGSTYWTEINKLNLINTNIAKEQAASAKQSTLDLWLDWGN